VNNANRKLLLAAFKTLAAGRNDAARFRSDVLLYATQTDNSRRNSWQTRKTSAKIRFAGVLLSRTGNIAAPRAKALAIQLKLIAIVVTRNVLETSNRLTALH
jgi:hypothetical protein